MQSFAFDFEKNEEASIITQLIDYESFCGEKLQLPSSELKEEIDYEELQSLPQNKLLLVDVYFLE